jgi:citrate synthase
LVVNLESIYQYMDRERDIRADEATPGLLDAAEAAARLRVSRATLYAYVSRGLIRSLAKPGDPRAALYPAADIAALLRRKARQRRPAMAAATALDWGLPVLETRITRIEGGRLAYRGEDAIALAGHVSFEAAARLLWNAADDPFVTAAAQDGIIRRRAARPAPDPAATPVDRAMALLPVLPAEEEAAPGTPMAMRAAAHRLRALAWAAADADLAPGLPLHIVLARAWRRPGAADAIRRALVLCADHELNASTFAVRVVASTGASLTASLLAGLAALSGPSHGGMTLRIAALLDEAQRLGDADAALRTRMKSGAFIPGFGHRLYPDGDPRAAALLPHIGRAPLAAKLAAAMERRTGLRPNIDFALVALERGQRLPPGAALALFAIGRAAGWIAHAFEQRAQGLIRPRARFVEDAPAGADE